MHVNIAAKYRFKSISQKDMSMLLRCTSLHSSQIGYIAEHLREKRAICKYPTLKNSLCVIHCKIDSVGPTVKKKSASARINLQLVTCIRLSQDYLHTTERYTTAEASLMSTENFFSIEQ
jgi:hypothetical protein